MVQEWEVRQVIRAVKTVRERVSEIRKEIWILGTDSETALNALLEASCKLSEAIGALSVVNTE